MNYKKIYDSLIQKRRIFKIDRTPENINVEYHHIIPVSCNGKNDERCSNCNNEQFNIVGLTLDEHFFAHLLLIRIYKEKYGTKHKFYKNMLRAVMMMGSYNKYQIKTSKIYKKIKLEYLTNNLHKTTTGRFWVTDGINDKFLKLNDPIPNNFYKGRSYGGEEKQKEISNRISAHTKGRTCWNKGKQGCYSDEYRKKISDNHADVSGENNGRYGSRMMFNIETQTKKLVQKDDIQLHLNQGYVFTRNLKVFNDGQKDILADKCPEGFCEGSFKCNIYWWNNGVIEKMCKECPPGFKRGRLKKEK